MLKLMLGLAAVVIVVLVIVLIAARSIRSEEADEAEVARSRPGAARGRRDDEARGPDPRRGRSHPAMPGADRERRGREYAEPPRRSRGRGDDERYQRGARSRTAHGPDDQPIEQWRPDFGDRDEPPARRPARPGQERERVPRQNGRRRSADSDQWSSTEWEKLSDVDYWAELSAEKPLAAQPEASARPARLPQRGPAAGPGAASQAPVRAAGHPRDLVPAPVDTGAGRRSPAAAGSGPLPVPGQLPAPGRPRNPRDPRNLPAADDDPLTSPSFPRIPAIDGRSYASRRAAGADGIRGPGDGAGQQRFGGPGMADRHYSGPVTPAGLPPAGGPRDRYHAGHRSGPLPVPPRTAAGVPGNPYGSYVTPGGDRDHGRPPPADEPGPAHDSLLAPPASYPGPGSHAAPGYLPGAGNGYRPGAGNGYHHDPGYQSDAYPTAAYGTARYLPPGYPSAHGGQPGRESPHNGQRQPGYRV